MTLKILVIGCGSIGARHVANAAKRAAVAVVDPDRSRAEKAASESGAAVFADIDTALGWKPDAAIVATPPRYHLGIADQLVSAGVPVLIEKPIAPPVEAIKAVDAVKVVDDFLDDAKARGVPVYVARNLRFHPGPATLKTHLSTIGRPLLASAHYSSYLPDMRPDVDYRTLYVAREAESGGVIFDSIHEIDYLAWILGKGETRGCKIGRVGDLEIDAGDHATLIMEHETGTSSTVQFDFLGRPKSRGCKIVGTEGTLIWQSDGKSPEHCLVKRIDPKGITTLLFEDRAYNSSAMYVEMLQDFLEYITNRSAENMVESGSEARDAFSIACTARELAKGRLSRSAA
jgi:predicted dehydrogenase